MATRPKPASRLGYVPHAPAELNIECKQHPETNATATRGGEQRTAQAPVRPVKTRPSAMRGYLEPQSLLVVLVLQNVYVLSYQNTTAGD